MRAFLQVVAVWAICLPLSPWTTTQEKQAKTFLDQGMSTLQNGDKEEACFLFEKARIAASQIADADQRSKFAELIDVQAALADSLTQKRRKAEGIAARALLRAGKVYLKKGWISTASPFIAEAALLSPKLAAADIKLLSEANPSARVGSGDQIFAVFGHMANVYRQPDWVKDKQGLRAPVDDIDGASMLLSKSVVTPGTKIHLEVLASEAECRIGLAIGFNEDRSFHLIELYRNDGSTEVRCQSYSRNFKTLVKVNYASKKREWKQWVSFDIEIREKELTWKIGKSKTYVTRCKNPDLSGKLGLYIFYGDDNAKDFIFRNFRMETL